MMPASLLFVCLGNICRSPAAEGVVRRMAAEAGLDLRIDSAGTGDWHLGAPPDPRMIAAAARRGVDLSGLRARQVRPQDFQEFTHIFAMDRSNLVRIEAVAPNVHAADIRLFLADTPDLSTDEVPDPYFGAEDGFEAVLDLIEAGGRGLLATLRADR